MIDYGIIHDRLLITCQSEAVYWCPLTNDRKVSMDEYIGLKECAAEQVYAAFMGWTD